MTISTQIQLSNPDNMVTLYTLDTTMIGGTDIFYFTKRVRETTNILFGGFEYYPLDCDVTGFVWDARGALPRPKITVSNVTGIWSGLVQSLNDLIGAKLTRIRTFEKYLDDGATPDSLATLPLDIFTIEQKTRQNKVFIEWQLSSILDQSGRMLPGRLILRDVCTNNYRVQTPLDFDYSNVTCPWVGSTYFDESDSPGIKANDQCSRRLTGCQARFGENNVLPFAGFPGVAKVRS